MIVDYYIPTRTVNSLELRIVTSSTSPLEVRLNGSSPQPVPLNRSFDGTHFFKQTINGLAPGAQYALAITQRGQTEMLKAETLCPPPGKRLASIGLAPDPHLDAAYPLTPGALLPGKRLYGQANFLFHNYLNQMAALGAERAVIPGDIYDYGSKANLELAKKLIGASSIPCHVLIGNHESFGYSESAFYQAFNMPRGGYYRVDLPHLTFLMLSTTGQDSLSTQTGQWEWLKDMVLDSPDGNDIILFAHFSLLLHPCNTGHKNDGYQILHQSGHLLDLMRKTLRIRAYIAGHKNVPSLIFKDGKPHLLSPQLFQAPCGFDILTFYQGGFTRSTYEIDEQDFVWSSRQACGALWPDRYGAEQHRNFTYTYPEFAT